MSVLLQFKNVSLDKVSNLSFSVLCGEARVLHVDAHDAKTAVIEMALGELLPASGEILLFEQAREASKPGTIGWVPAEGGLISNLKSWENITLPSWYHNNRQKTSTEENVSHWLKELGIDQQDWERFMASPVARLSQWERKMAGLLRGLILAPRLLVIDAGLFDGVDADRVQVWISVLDKFLSESKDRAMLVITSASTPLPWKVIE